MTRHGRDRRRPARRSARDAVIAIARRRSARRSTSRRRCSRPAHRTGSGCSAHGASARVVAAVRRRAHSRSTPTSRARVDQSSLDRRRRRIAARVASRCLADRVVASASIGNGYAPPSLADQFFHEGVLVRPNPALRPERTTARRRGATRRFTTSTSARCVLTGDAAAFRANVDGMILWLPDFRFIWSPSNFDGSPLRMGAERARGAGPRARRRSGNTQSLRRHVRGPGAERSGRVSSAHDGEHHRRRRRRTGGHFELANRYVGARRTVPGSALNTLDPYWLTDARWTYVVRARSLAARRRRRRREPVRSVRSNAGRLSVSRPDLDAYRSASAVHHSAENSCNATHHSRFRLRRHRQSIALVALVAARACSDSTATVRRAGISRRHERPITRSASS